MGGGSRTPPPGRTAGELRAVSEALRRVDRLRRSGLYDEALARVRALAEQQPTDARVQLELGLTLGVWGRAPEAALPHYERALALGPTLLSARLHRAIALARLGRHAEAVDELDRLEALRYRNALVLCMLRAEAHGALGHPDAAEHDWTRALTLDPGNAWLHAQRAHAREQLGRLEGARDDLDRALEDGPDPHLLEARARVRERLGDPAGARADRAAARASA